MKNMLKQLGWKTETFVTMLVVRLWLLFPTTIPVALTSGLTPVLTVLAAKLGLTPPRPSMLGWVSALWVPNLIRTLSVDGRLSKSSDVWWLHRCRVVGVATTNVVWISVFLVGIRGARWFAITSFPAFELLYTCSWQTQKSLTCHESYGVLPQLPYPLVPLSSSLTVILSNGVYLEVMAVVAVRGDVFALYWKFKLYS